MQAVYKSQTKLLTVKGPVNINTILKRGCYLVSLTINHIQSTLVLQTPHHNEHNPDNVELGQQLNLAVNNVFKTTEAHLYLHPNIGLVLLPPPPPPPTPHPLLVNSHLAFTYGQVFSLGPRNSVHKYKMVY